MDQLPAFGKKIEEIVMPTMKAYAPLLQRNADFIKSVKKETFTYGSHERQQLDVYSPLEAKITNGRRPVLMFEYGGGFVNGAKTLMPMPDGLVHANIGAFFANHFGYTVVVADYRLMSHGAKFPSGGEDIALAVEWICENEPGPGSEPIDLFTMGNSAGGVHLSTFLLHQSFSKTRRKVLTGNKTRLRGAVMLSVPFDFNLAPAYRSEILKSYFSDIEANCPLGLLRTAQEKVESIDFVNAGAKVLVLSGELDPDNDILIPRDNFVDEWLHMGENDYRVSLAVDSMPRHNHISPFASLGTGIEEEEAWGCQVAAFCDNIRKFAPR
ncbi:Uu.00g052110.m01.CDS01 [Anthostomella pinea]|uniref:Uu.00g052110.m01.CDS01 n=1 Tax=Anthostomella pinea TaxID=933095 RepID=A0AAI8VW78_9PEZI|nr:Uu.00g052110.m01.CDS01 [Anthostomella pinea]